MEIKSERMNEVECSGMVTWKFIAKSIFKGKLHWILFRCLFNPSFFIISNIENGNFLL